MPVEELSTGVDLYYESQGRGEAVVFIPGTGFAGNVWMETQAEPLSRSLRSPGCWFTQRRVWLCRYSDAAKTFHRRRFPSQASRGEPRAW